MKHKNSSFSLKSYIVKKSLKSYSIEKPICQKFYVDLENKSVAEQIQEIYLNNGEIQIFKNFHDIIL